MLQRTPQSSQTPPSAMGLNSVHYFVSIAVTKDQKLGGLNDRHLLPHSSGGQKSEIKLLGGWFLRRPTRKGSSLGLCPQMADSRLLVHLVFSLYVWVQSSLPDDSHIGLGPALMTAL